jgi:hypothetical protein
MVIALQSLAWETGHFAGCGKLTHSSVSYLSRMEILRFSALRKGAWQQAEPYNNFPDLCFRLEAGLEPVVEPGTEKYMIFR